MSIFSIAARLYEQRISLETIEDISDGKKSGLFLRSANIRGVRGENSLVFWHSHSVEREEGFQQTKRTHDDNKDVCREIRSFSAVGGTKAEI